MFGLLYNFYDLVLKFYEYKIVIHLKSKIAVYKRNKKYAKI
jgi:hypothetical protein